MTKETLEMLGEAGKGLTIFLGILGVMGVLFFANQALPKIAQPIEMILIGLSAVVMLVWFFFRVQKNQTDEVNQ
jgi:hypothetical protein